MNGFLHTLSRGKDTWSTIVHSTPERLSRLPQTEPAGPAPMINTSICFTSLIYSLSSRIFIISTAAFATEVPGPKMAATPAL